MEITRKAIIICLFGFFLCMGPFIAEAQKKETAKDIVDGFSKWLDSEKVVSPDKILQTKSAQEGATSSNNAEYDSIRFKRELARADFAERHQERTFAWQYYSGIVIFIMVMLIVIMGLVLSFKQFQLTEKQVHANITKPKAETSAIESTTTDIEISQTGLKINTGVIGLAILFLSLAFFFLYLKYVYGISAVDTGL